MITYMVLRLQTYLTRKIDVDEFLALHDLLYLMSFQRPLDNLDILQKTIFV